MSSLRRGKEENRSSGEGLKEKDDWGEDSEDTDQKPKGVRWGGVQLGAIKTRGIEVKKKKKGTAKTGKRKENNGSIELSGIG